MTSRPVEKNRLYDVEITGMTHQGLGVAKVNNFPIFIKNSLPGESISVKIIAIKKNFAIGKVLQMYKKSEDRVEPNCPIYNQCGGCSIQHLSYNGQLTIKKDMVQETLKRIGKIDINVHDCIGMDDSWKYRNKTQVPFGLSNGNVVAGFYKENTHEIIDMTSCDIQDKVTDEIINYMKVISKRYNITPYNEESHSGILRHVIVRKGYITDEYMVTLVTKEENLKNKEEVINDLITKFPLIKSIIQNINKSKTNTIMGEKTVVLYGKPYIYDYIGDVKFAISSRSFYQVNPVQTKKLYDKVLEYANLTGNEYIIDAYCGIGTIGLYLSKQAKAIYGVEIIPDAIENAKLNAKLNNFTNAHYEAGKAEEIIKNWQEDNIKPDVIVVDPPRKGCDKKLLETIIEMEIPRIVYVSCDPATLARDLKILNENNYKIIEVQPVDMFPHTMHVECVIGIQRKDTL
ncbi:23S rRNA (uracil(1939)-C(5))-methyltransferase RlmD [Mycoplasmatota bacterium]|nr:23S rRNA (uracil(1939)-C(5))-methyltransferase RlmD [Mycoplasmatota bacterium]